MSSRIMEVVEEAKVAATLVTKTHNEWRESLTLTEEAEAAYRKAKESYAEAERKLKGVIYEETQG